MSKCEICEGYNALSTEHHRQYEIPDVYEALCRDCAEHVNTHSAEDMTDGELIAAIMDDSLGYASPEHARQHVEAFREGENFVYCERARSCYPADPDDYSEEEWGSETGIHPGDLSKLIDSARRRWCAMSEEKREDLREFADEWDSIDNRGSSMSVSAAYPTLGP